MSDTHVKLLLAPTQAHTQHIPVMISCNRTPKLQAVGEEQRGEEGRGPLDARGEVCCGRRQCGPAAARSHLPVEVHRRRAVAASHQDLRRHPGKCADEWEVGQEGLDQQA